MTKTISGKCEEQFSAVSDAFSANLASGEDVGASVAVTVDGEMVVDLWGGYLDEAKQQPWQEDTIVNVYSTTKTMSFLCALILADRGQLDFDARQRKCAGMAPDGSCSGTIRPGCYGDWQRSL